MSMAMGMMKKVMFKVSQSRLSYEETVKKVHEKALEVGWDVPMVFELQKHYIEHGLSDMSKATNIYLCNPQGGYEIMKDDEFKPMSVMMPTPVSVYENSAGGVFVGLRVLRPAENRRSDNGCCARATPHPVRRPRGDRCILQWSELRTQRRSSRVTIHKGSDHGQKEK